MFLPIIREKEMNEENRKIMCPKFQVLNVRVSAISPEQVVETIRGWIEEKKTRYINIINVATIMCCVDSPELTDIVNNSSLTIPDGMPLVFLGKLAGLNAKRCYGPDIMLDIIKDGVSYGYKHFFYGNKMEVLNMLEDSLKEMFKDIKIVGKIPSPFRPETDEEKKEFTKIIDESGADIVWVGSGTPLHDYWSAEYSTRLNSAVIIPVGGAFNVHAGNVKQAPRWMMNIGMEWFFRLCIEPKRLWRRYIIGNTRFILLLLKQIITKKPAPLGRVENG